MLRAGVFTLPALDTIGGLALAGGGNAVLTHTTKAFVIMLTVRYCYDLRDRDIHRTAIGTVVASGAGNGLICIQSVLRLADDLLFDFGERLEFFHIRKVLLHLLQV